MATARDLINGSLRLINVLAASESPTATEAANALSVLNDMLDQWSTEKLTIFETAREKFLLIAGTSQYTLGPTGTWVTTRPVFVETAYIEDQASSPKIERPVEVISGEEWAAIPAKDISTPYPTKLWMTGSYPNQTVNLYPVPSTANKLVLQELKPLTAFASLDTAVSLPPGYSKAIRYCLAVELAVEFARPVDGQIVAIAQESKTNIKRMNMKPLLSTPDGFGRRRRFCMLTGE